MALKVDLLQSGGLTAILFKWGRIFHLEQLPLFILEVCLLKFGIHILFNMYNMYIGLSYCVFYNVE